MAKTPPRTTIILEGPDGAGKSTLGEQLADALGYEYVHTGGAARTLCMLIQRMLELEEQGAKGKGVIFDRVPHISDSIYKEAMGEPRLMHQGRARGHLKNMGPIVVVYCRLRDSEAMLANILETKKSHKPPEYLEKVKASYPAIVEAYDWEMADLRETGVEVIQYDWTEHDFDTLLKVLKVTGVRSCAA